MAFNCKNVHIIKVNHNNEIQIIESVLVLD